MKTSNKILTGTFIGIFAICVTLLLILRFSIGDSISGQGSGQGKAGSSPQKGRQTVYMTGVKTVDLKGNWRADITYSDTENIVVEGPQYLLRRLLISQGEDSLGFYMPDGQGKRKLHLSLSLPMLERLRIKGVTDVNLSGLRLDHLTVQSEGVTSIEAENGRANYLDFTGKGVSKLDFEDFPTQGANLVGKGVTKVKLSMAGGPLTGQIEGVGDVSYQGDTAGESIRTKGPCKVRRK